MTPLRLSDPSGSAGLVLLAFVAEWNRRNSPGDSVFKDLPPHFGVKAARGKLFTVNNQPTPFLRGVLKETCERFFLRHAFAADQEEDVPYYLSVQLQYGFSLPHAREQLGNWLQGRSSPGVARRLLEPEGYYRSASFQRLVRDMKSYRQTWLPESEFRRTLRENPWVLPAWENEIVTLINGIPLPPVIVDPEFRLLSDPRVTWESGPEVSCRLCALPDWLTAPRYLLRHAGRDIARYYRHCSGAIEADRCAAQIPLDGPEAIVTLETPDGEVVEVQTIRLWDPEFVAQVRPVGRATEEAVERLLPGEQVLITSTEAAVTPAPSAWRVLGPREGRRCWWLLEGTEPVRVEDRGVVWNGEPPPPPPAWANGVRVSLEKAGSIFQLGERLRFRIDVSQGVEVAHASCASQLLSFTDSARTRTTPVPVRAEMSGRCRFRVGVTQGGESAVIQREVNLPIRAMAWAADGCEIPRNEAISCFEAMNRPVRLLSDGPSVLIEGREIIGPFPAGRAARIRRVLGTGKEVIVADRPFNTHDRFRLSRWAVDTGLAQSLERKGKRFRLSLFRSLLPSERHRLVLWSPSHGIEILGPSEISTEDGGRVWAFCAPWDPDELLAAIAYEGRYLAGWCGQDRRFYDPQATDGLDPLSRIAMIRWCRLPGLRPDPDAQQHPLIGRLAHFPLAMVRVALLDEGLPEGLDLVFEDRQSPRGELFNVIFREAYLWPTQGDLAAVYDNLPFDRFSRLMAYHPLLGYRSLQAVLPRLVQESLPQALMILDAMQCQLLSVSAGANSQITARREAELLDRARITCCENGEPMDENAVREGLARPMMRHLFEDAPLGSGHEDNLRTALGVAPFREYLAAMILRRLFEQLA